MQAPKQYTNRLIDETSPYLLQHAHNPVDWYPWGDEAFAKANGFAGTPVIVRASDGAVLHGFRDSETLRAFAAGGKEPRS